MQVARDGEGAAFVGVDGPVEAIDRIRGDG
jgi:hypothetical protein